MELMDWLQLLSVIILIVMALTCVIYNHFVTKKRISEMEALLKENQALMNGIGRSIDMLDSTHKPTKLK